MCYSTNYYPQTYREPVKEPKIEEPKPVSHKPSSSNNSNRVKEHEAA